MKQTDIAVSVIIPTYNRADLVDRCLTSIHHAGIPRIEVIVVDDGGTDDTASVVEGHGLYLRQENAGPGVARNRGFEASRGRFIAFIDSDDAWVDGAVVRLVEQMEANPDIDVIFADSLMGNDTDGFVSFLEAYGSGAFFNLPHARRADGLRVLERRPFFLQLSTRNVMFLGSMIIRREFLLRIGGFDPALRGAAEDWELFMRMAASGVVAYSEGPAVSRYYKHGTGLSDNLESMQEGFIRALDAVRSRVRLDAVERRHVDDRIRAQTFGWAWNAYQRGDMRLARQRLRLARKLGGFGMREAGYFAATYLPAGAIDALRRLRSAADPKA